MTKRGYLLLLFLVVAKTAHAQSPLEKWVLSKGFKVRLNPNSSSLVGEIYPDKDVNRGSRIARMENCWPSEFVSRFKAGQFTQNAAKLEITGSMGVTSIGAFLRLARKPGAGTESDVQAVQAELSNKKVRIISIQAADQFENPISAFDLLDKSQELDQAKRQMCLAAAQDSRNIIVLNALGVKSLSYEFLDNSNSRVQASATLLKLLFNLGISRDATAAGTVEFTEPAYVGFQISRWCKGRNAFLPDGQKCK